jgi:hypothetical protein
MLGTISTKTKPPMSQKIFGVSGRITPFTPHLRIGDFLSTSSLSIGSSTATRQTTMSIIRHSSITGSRISSDLEEMSKGFQGRTRFLPRTFQWRRPHRLTNTPSGPLPGGKSVPQPTMVRRWLWTLRLYPTRPSSRCNRRLAQAYHRDPSSGHVCHL